MAITDLLMVRRVWRPFVLICSDAKSEKSIHGWPCLTGRLGGLTPGTEVIPMRETSGISARSRPSTKVLPFYSLVRGKFRDRLGEERCQRNACGSA